MFCADVESRVLVEREEGRQGKIEGRHCAGKSASSSLLERKVLLHSDLPMWPSFKSTRIARRR
jgi:hypothetical protein